VVSVQWAFQFSKTKNFNVSTSGHKKIQSYLSGVVDKGTISQTSKTTEMSVMGVVYTHPLSFVSTVFVLKGLTVTELSDTLTHSLTVFS
jgi:hypothetical protein